MSFSHLLFLSFVILGTSCGDGDTDGDPGEGAGPDGGGDAALPEDTAKVDTGDGHSDTGDSGSDDTGEIEDTDALFSATRTLRVTFLGQSTEAKAISDDGCVVVGKLEQQAMYWSESSGLVPMGYLNSSGYQASTAYGVNADGSVIVGSTSTTSRTPHAFVWSGAMAPLPDRGGNVETSNSVAYGITPGGDVMVGYDSNGGTYGRIWPGTAALPFLPDASSFFLVASAISGDGSTIVGWGSGKRNTEAFRYRGGVLETFGVVDATSSEPGTNAYAVNHDGSTWVGSGGPGTPYAVSWTEGVGFTKLGALPGSQQSVAWDLTADARRIVGETIQGAFVWDPTHGMRELKALLGEQGIAVDDWELNEIVGMTPDGAVMVGNGLFKGRTLSSAVVIRGFHPRPISGDVVPTRCL